MMKTLTIGVFLILWPLSQTQFYNCLAVMEALLGTQEMLIQHIERYERYITDAKKALLVKRIRIDYNTRFVGGAPLVVLAVLGPAARAAPAATAARDTNKHGCLSGINACSYLFLSRCRREHEQSLDGEHYLGNPINAFTLIMRLTRDLDYIEGILNVTTAGMKYVPNNSLLYPAEEDVVGVVEGLTRLQIMYDLDVKDLANGTLITTYSSRTPDFTEYTTPMTSCDCYELGLVQYEKKSRSRNIAWMKEALRRYQYDADCPINKVDIYDRLSGDFYYMGDHASSKYWIQKRIEASPSDPQNDKFKKALLILDNYSQKIIPSTKPRNRVSDSYPGLCLKEHFSPNASLTCYYAHGPHSFLLLAPMKAERLHISPDILLFHDVITDAEILEIRALSRPRFHTAKATTHAGVSKVQYCVHQVAWLQDIWSNATLRVAKRIAQFSGLAVNVNTTEDFQVANYGTGGFYGPHFDFIRPIASSSNGTEKRFATALFYIADVKVGGATVFTKLGLSVLPVKHAAIFWWNLDPTGNDDPRTQHAACPVLRGSRWVMSKWISLSGQELIRPCPASSLERIDHNSPSNYCPIRQI